MFFLDSKASDLIKIQELITYIYEINKAFKNSLVFYVNL